MKLKLFAGAAVLVSSAGAFAALPDFTFDPSAVGIGGSSFTADAVLVSDFATVKFTSPTTFKQEGFLSVTGFMLNDQQISPTGLNTGDYGMYVHFTGAGTLTSGAGVSVGTFTSLSYDLYGYSGGPAAFGFNGSNDAYKVTSTTDVLLASGALVLGTGTAVFIAPPSPAAFATASTTMTFLVEPGSAGFFVAPSPSFYPAAQATFTNTAQQLTAFSGGIMLNSGGGSINMIPVPEPETYAMMLAGLCAIGFLAWRRQNG